MKMFDWTEISKTCPHAIKEEETRVLRHEAMMAGRKNVDASGSYDSGYIDNSSVKTQKKHDSGWCAKCESYCWGDCS